MSVRHGLTPRRRIA